MVTASKAGPKFGACSSPIRYCTDQAIREALQTFCPKEGVRALDVGCGVGYFPLLVAAGVRGDYLGIDIQARDSWPDTTGMHAGLSVGFLEHDAELLSTLGSRFNFVMAIQSMEHISDDVRAFQGMSQCLEPGGLLLMTVPSKMSRVALYPGHGWRGYTRADLRRLADLARLDLIKIKPLGGLLPFALHFLGWTLPYVGSARVTKAILGRPFAIGPCSQLYSSNRAASWIVRRTESIAAAVPMPSLGLEGGFGAVFRKPVSAD